MIDTALYTGFYINIDRMSRRQQFMENQIKLVGLDNVIKRWVGIDATSNLDITNSSFIPGHWKAPKWNLSAVEVAIFESHRAIWSYLLKYSNRPLVVLEDDVVLSSEFHHIVNSLINANIVYDVIKLDGIHKVRRFSSPVSIESNTITSFEVRPIVQTVWSACGYLVSRQGARKLMQWSTSYSDCVDDFLFRPRPNYSLLQLFPAACIQGMLLFSNSNHSDETSFFGHGEDTQSSERDKRDNGPIMYRVMRETKRGFKRLERSLFFDKHLLREGGFIGRVPLSSDLSLMQTQKQLREI